MSDNALRPLHIFYGMSSPWAYLGSNRALSIARQAGVPVVLRPIRIIEPNGGIPLRTRPKARQDYHRVELSRWSEFLAIPLNLTPRYYPCRSIEPAAQAVIAAQRAGLDAPAFSFAIQRALWAEDRDIASVAVLQELAHLTLGSAGSELMRQPPAAEVVGEWQDNLAEAERRGIFGTPTYVVDDELFWGQDRLDFVARALAAQRSAYAESSGEKS
ncbi:2-hydroxychromene-2-carboxylate isomerase [Biostraticola tofi]|uniref:2-hydroxychromene-2-carboxylate isomerase n=1 Tax=Biostraticola tofi TaxID=466109 RepID=A0A4R3YN33_9GAMM|nr:2-hydroxychromene-2-carboxylate isomerase [Biostraticola tofi]TCV93721.1 2-hydroxychromene-2-carboxylate isomerase [Biostraticola tofi]